MIVERRQRVRKCYKNYAEMPANSGDSHLNEAKQAEIRRRLKRTIPVKESENDVLLFAISDDWEDDSALTTPITPKIVLILYALLTCLAYFAIGSYFFLR
ncbi:hypothetical protein MCAMS1_01727 [biofilm metagenome]